MSNLIPTVETCIKLQELGFPQDPKQTHFGWLYTDGESCDGHEIYPSQWYYADWSERSEGNYFKPDWADEHDEEQPEIWEYAAPTLQELWDMLPDTIEKFWGPNDSHPEGRTCTHRKEVFCISGYGVGYIGSGIYVSGDNLAQAAAELWIECKEKGFIQIPTIPAT